MKALLLSLLCFLPGLALASDHTAIMVSIWVLLVLVVQIVIVGVGLELAPQKGPKVALFIWLGVFALMVAGQMNIAQHGSLINEQDRQLMTNLLHWPVWLSLPLLFWLARPRASKK